MIPTTNYVVAGGFNFIGQIDKRLPRYKNKFSLDLDPQSIKYCLSKILSKSLLSFGILLSKNKKSFTNEASYINSIQKLLSECKKYNHDIIPDNFKVYLDSGGFQLSVGYLDQKYIYPFIDMYTSFLKNNSNIFDLAFSLDIPPNEITFSSYQDIYNWNKYSYTKLLDLPENIREKIIYVYHFRTPEVNKIWRKMLFDEGLAEQLNCSRWSVGGIVASLKGEDDIPYISYGLPLANILNYTLHSSVHKDAIHFHVLGGSAYRDVIFYELCKLHIKKLYNITVNFSFDSSGLFKQFMMGRFLDVLTDDLRVLKLPVNSNILDSYNRSFGLNIKNIDKCRMILEEISTTYNLPNITNYNIYDKDTGSFNMLVELYLCFYLLHFYYILQNECSIKAIELYDIYLKDKTKFENVIFTYLQNLNRGVISSRLKMKSLAFSRTLDLFENLDYNKTNAIIDKYMAKDEFKKLVRNIATF